MRRALIVLAVVAAGLAAGAAGTASAGAAPAGPTMTLTARHVNGTVGGVAASWAGVPPFSSRRYWH
jgi:hypothetical protein